MPFRLQGTPATFQRMINMVSDDVGEFAAAYLDDVVISWDDHVRHLFIENFAEKAMALTDLTRKNALNNELWTTTCDTAFTTLKTALCSAAVLRSPDFR